MTAQILLHPRYWRVERPVAGLRDALAQALATEAEWYCHLGPELAACYWAAFGDLELAWARAQARGAGAQEAGLAAGRRQFHDALVRLSRDALEAGRARDFLSDYRKLVRVLHPEVVGPAIPETHAARWPAVQKAFAAGDAYSLRAHAAAVTAPATEPLAPVAEFRRLQSTLAEARMRLRAMRDRFPFNLRGVLDDPAWIAAKRDEMAAALARAPASFGRGRLAQVS